MLNVSWQLPDFPVDLTKFEVIFKKFAHFCYVMHTFIMFATNMCYSYPTHRTLNEHDLWSICSDVKCFSHPTSGSFLRPRKANFGVALMRALNERYGIIDSQLADQIHNDMFVVGHKQRTTVEVVGIERLNKQQRWCIFLIRTEFIWCFDVLYI